MTRPSHHQDHSVSYRGADLANAEFSHADIRGVDFTGSSLIGANFTHAQAGLTSRWVAGLLAGAAVASVLAGFIAGFAGAIWALSASLPVELFGETHRQLLPIMAFAVLAISLTTLYRRGFAAFLSVYAIVSALLIALTAALTTIELGIFVMVVLGLGIGAVIAAITTLATAIALVISLERSRLAMLFIVMAAFAALAGMWEGVWGFREDLDPSVTSPVAAFVIAGSVALCVLVLGHLIASRVVRGNERFNLAHRLVLWLLTVRGTRFCGCDLSDATFANAELRYSDFRGAKLLRTDWAGAQHLEQCRTENTYLERPDVLRLVTTKIGAAGSYDRANLEGLNLAGADLTDASFVDAILDRSTLRHANLARAKLANAHLHGVDLRQACLTGAYIENWALSTETQLSGVICDYIYVRLPTTEDPDPWRKPDNHNARFRPGEFEDFIAPIFKTLDLYRRRDVDPHLIGQAYKTLDLFLPDAANPAVSIAALQQLADQHPAWGLSLTAVEGSGQDKMRFQVSVPGQADRSRLSEDYEVIYRQLASLSEADLASLIAQAARRDERIREVEELVLAAAHSKKFLAYTQIRLGKVMKSILLSANPLDTERLSLDIEIREILEKIRSSEYRDVVELIPVLAARPDDILQALNMHRPEIVHFSGHGTSDGEIVVLDTHGQAKPISTQALQILFRAMQDNVRLVILNACYSEVQAQAIIESIDCAIGMQDALSDEAAIKFIASFYRAIGFGRSVKAAFDQGIAALMLEGIPEADTPKLLCRPGVDPSTIVLVSQATKSI